MQTYLLFKDICIVFILLKNLYISIIMYGFEFNKFLASLIVAIIVFVIIGFLGNLIVDVNDDQNLETAYKIDVPEIDQSSNETSSANDTVESISLLLASASITDGEKVFKKCGTCHTYSKDGQSKVGPNLWNIINNSKASVSGFAYSNALKNSGGTWSYEELNAFLYKPKDYLPGTKMNFSGLKKANDRANLILWLRDQSDDPVPLP